MTTGVGAVEPQAVPLDTWAEALEGHRRIEALYADVAARRAWFRDMGTVSPGIPLPTGKQGLLDPDRVFCALAIKAATTKRAIATLCEAGDGENALALMRVLLENALLLEWFLGGTGRRRLETYVLFTSVLYEETVSTMDLMLRQKPHLAADFQSQMASDPYHKAITASVFQDRDETWAFFPDPNKPGQLNQVGIKRIFKDVTEVEAEESVDYRCFYKLLGSQAIHSGPFSLSRFLAAVTSRDTFMLDAIRSEKAETLALALSNASMLMALDALNAYAYLGLEDKLATIKDWMRRHDKVEAGP